MMLETALRLASPSARCDVPPFIVMDVMAAAARIEAAGGHVIHMEVGQPAAPAPKMALDAVRAALGDLESPQEPETARSARRHPHLPPPARP